jgi:hypothetical protein
MGKACAAGTVIIHSAHHLHGALQVTNPPIAVFLVMALPVFLPTGVAAEAACGGGGAPAGGCALLRRGHPGRCRCACSTHQS